MADTTLITGTEDSRSIIIPHDYIEKAREALMTTDGGPSTNKDTNTAD